MTSAKFPNRASLLRRPLLAAATAVLLLLVILSIAGSFHRHLTPDVSDYLLIARTFSESANRFELSHGNKGIVLTLMLLPAIELFGVNISAVAFLQVLTYSASLVFLHLITRRYLSPPVSLVLGLLYLALVYSPGMWGANGRPEDFCAPLTIAAIYAALRGGKKMLILGGGLTALIAFTKMTLAVGPLAVGIAALLADTIGIRHTRATASLRDYPSELLKNTGCFLLGLVGIAILLLGWTLFFDNISGWYRQIVFWPKEYRNTSLSPAGIDNLLALLKRAGIGWLIAGGAAGVVVGWIRGPRRLALLVTILFVAESFRISQEMVFPPGWHYVLLPLVIPALLGNSFWATVKKPAPVAAFGWLIPVLLSGNVLAHSYHGTIKSLHLRALLNLPAPYEYLARRMEPLYSPGEVVFIDSNDCQLLLLLDAPRPYYVSTGHLHLISESEQRHARKHYSTRIPDWVIRRDPENSFVEYLTLGRVDAPYHIYFPVGETSPGDRSSTGYAIGDICPGNMLNPHFLPEQNYRLEIDTGYVQAWRKVDLSRQGGFRKDSTDDD